MDTLDHRLLREVQADARLSYAELGRRVGLSPPAVAERLRRLEASGVVTGYHAAVDPARLGRPVQAILHMQVDRARFQRSVEQIQQLDDVLQCYRTTGSSSLVMVVAVASTEALEALIDRLLPFGEPVTQLVLSVPVPRRPVAPNS
ncbi:Lrp/AsnC family transcriptional regulator [Rubrivirga sp. S365]|uniref:Lrp/AsnC family transcriptional regulator n=1 Tax=Rubrivirga litoralis TaxID=3075598 RepID=A0ABU3BN35_9BACT|nr:MULTISPECIES: Lrp/AsnC family transcriptional regulator [unclassified Rubrivirga]MDT0630702.1 Lrp/AsnC family transcriptional regulator [Rubrivirga sp. F394]MDT7856274.1 Lrp/AsnC family transcriptional regulator [Rubrivirga sp. S365]